jgi:P-type E1-E2 ATPase
MAERETEVIVIREGETVKVKNHDLVPGDVVIPAKNEEISYDGILVSGEVFVNEASLTGESIPVGKFPALDLAQTKKETTWIVEGSKVLEVR